MMLFDGIWGRELVRRLIGNFGEQALDGAGGETDAALLKAQVLWFQMLRHMQDVLGIVLGADVEMELLKSGPRPLEYPDDVQAANPSFLEVADDDWESDQKLQIEQTEEFKRTLQALDGPRDVFREVNPNEFGADFAPSVRQMFNYDEGRTHHMLAFDRVPSGGSGSGGKAGVEVQKLACVSCARVTLMGDSGASTDFLTWAPGVETVLLPSAADDGFIVM
jgi:hypothetical protein